MIFNPVKEGVINSYTQVSPQLDKIEIARCQNIIALVYNLDQDEQSTIFYKNLTNKGKSFRINNGLSPIFDWDSNSLLYLEKDENGRPFRVRQHDLFQMKGDNLILFEESNQKIFLDLASTKTDDFYILNASTKIGNELYLKIRNPKYNSYLQNQTNKESFYKIACQEDEIISVQQNRHGLYCLKKSSDKKSNNRISLVFINNVEIQKSLRIMSQNRTFMNNKIFDNIFKYETIYEFEAQMNIVEHDLFDDFLLLYSNQAGKSEITKIDLESRISSQIDFRNNKFGVLSPAINHNLNPESVRMHFDNTFVYNEIIEFDAKTDVCTVIDKFDYLGPRFDSDQFEISQITYASRDGLSIPLTLIYNKKFKLDTEGKNNLDFQFNNSYVSDQALLSQTFNSPMPFQNPSSAEMFNMDSQISKNPQKVLVKSYGVYGVSSQIEFNFADWNYLEKDYIIAIPHIRGGSDLGIDWHSCSLKSSKMNSILDLIDCFNFLESKSLFLFNSSR